jgi:hypothetical protein
MALLDKAAILAAPDIASEVVAVPEWGGEVRVRALSGAQRDEWEQMSRAAIADNRMPNARARLCVMAMVDEAGQRLFSVEDVEALGAKNAAALDRIWDAAARLSGLTAGSQEAAAKNSSAAPSGGSTSASPAS